MKQFQRGVFKWMIQCFGLEISHDKQERNQRFIEESIELVQSLGMPKQEVAMLLDYVYNRPNGEPRQEVGGVLVTLAALCGPNDLDMESCGEDELARIWTKIDKIRAKQATKPRNSPLPEIPKT